MFVAGDEAAGKKVVPDLVSALGFEAIDAGELTVARLLGAFCHALDSSHGAPQSGPQFRVLPVAALNEAEHARIAARGVH
jgi:predicted dinucleotide-binding enzyme